jgi:hypothetical protein
VDDRAPKPPLALDPSFLAGLSDLDQGLFDDPAPGEPSQGLTRQASAALSTASVALDAFEAPLLPGRLADASRPPKLLDLFPPTQRTELIDRAARDLPLPAEAAAPTSWRSRLMMALLMLTLMLAGAAGAGLMFRRPLRRVLARWHLVPVAAATWPPAHRSQGPSLSR